MWLPFSLVRRMTRPGSIVFHTARQPALRGTDGLSPRIVLCPVSAAVRGNDGGQVTGDVVFIPRFMALRVFTAINCPRLSYARVLTQPFLAVHRRHLTKTVMVAGYITGTVSEAQQLTVTALTSWFSGCRWHRPLRGGHCVDYHNGSG